MIVIADTSPLSYLVLIGKIEVVPRLYGRVIIPQAVFDELRASGAPPAVKQWIANTRDWLEIRRPAVAGDLGLEKLGAGEREAIALAEQLGADALILDERDGRREAVRRHLRVVGTLGLLFHGAEEGLLDFPEAIKEIATGGVSRVA